MMVWSHENPYNFMFNSCISTLIVGHYALKLVALLFGLAFISQTWAFTKPEERSCMRKIIWFINLESTIYVLHPNINTETTFAIQYKVKQFPHDKISNQSIMSVILWV